MMVFDTHGSRLLCLLFCLEGVTEFKGREMSSSTLIPHTNKMPFTVDPHYKMLSVFGTGRLPNSKKKQEIFNDAK